MCVYIVIRRRLRAFLEGKLLRTAGPMDGKLSTVTQVVVMFVCLIMDALQVLRRVAPGRRDLLIYYIENVST